MDKHINRAFEWVPPDLQPWVLVFLILSAFTAFTLSAWPKLSLLLKAGEENRLDQPLKRVFTTLCIAFGQKKLLQQEPRSGWMHALIFWGFLILLIRAGEFFVVGLFPQIDSHFSSTAPLILPYLWIKDGAVFMVTLATLYALYRRLVIKPDRLTLSGEGLLILCLILAIMVSDVLFDSAFLALNPDIKSSGPLAALFASFVSMLGKGWTGHLHSLAYWTHVSAILSFLTLLPRSKHFHILTAIPNVFLSNLNPGNGLHRINFEDEESFGITKVENFTWKQMLDLHTCTQCGRCDRVCPALATGKPLSPQQLTVDLRDHLNGPPDITLLGGVISDETLWACTTCGACESACPVMIEYVDKVIDLRRGLILSEDRYPKEFESAFKSLETQSNPWGFPKNSRSDWARSELDVPIWDKNNPTEYLYFVGCNGSFDTRGKKISESVVKALKQAGVSFSILGNDEGCTGDPARRAGNEYLFDMLASKNAGTFKQQGVQKVITHCPHCLNSLKNEYPEFGAHLEVIHHSELLETLIAEGKLSTGEKSYENVVVHDSCYLGRHNGVYDPPRNVLAEGTKEIQEVEQSRETGTCCGAGGARFLLEENTGTRMSHHRLDELMTTNPDTIAVSCPYCVLMLEDAVKAKGLKVQVKDIGEMLNAENR